MAARIATGIHLGNRGCHLVYGCYMSWLRVKLETDSGLTDFFEELVMSLMVSWFCFMKFKSSSTGKINLGQE